MVKCIRHGDSDCQICPYYEYIIEWEHGTERGRFWMGEEVGFSYGQFGDGIHLTPKNQEELLR